MGLIDPGTGSPPREWSTGGTADPAGPDIANLIGEQTRARPGETAVVCGRQHLSYRELDERAGRLARYLRAQGVTAEIPVGVCLERSPDQVVTLLAILRAGGAYVPLDPEAPAERNAYVARDTGMPLLVTQEAMRERVREAAVAASTRTVSLDGDRAAIARHDEPRPERRDEPRDEPRDQRQDEPQDQPRDQRQAGEPEPEPGQLAYLVYTSGSTGRPKGVMVERGPLSAHCRAMAGVYRLGPDDRVLQFSQYSADASLEQVLSALAAGACLVLRDTEVWPPRQLRDELVSQQVTVMNLAPSYWQQMVRDWAAEPARLADLRLRMIILGGERLPAGSVREWRMLGVPGVRVLNAYGPTEAIITATLGDAGSEEEAGEPVTIGRPLPGRTVHILDDEGRPVPAGTLGELHIGGPLLARGYLNQPATTKERFVPDPFDGRPGARLYRTGDLVRYRPDGRIEYHGRGDEQVKIRGYRIEPGEIEAVLEEHPAVAQAVVVAQGDGTARELVAFVVARTGATLPLQELRGYLAGRLPRHMQPTMMRQLTELPRLATGKPDRRSLPVLQHTREPEDTPYLPARGLAEQQLVQIFEELLDARPIGITDHFFHLGGNSLLGAQLIDRVERATGKKLALSTLFAKPTVEELAQSLQDAPAETGDRTPVLPVRAEGRRTPFFFLHGDWTGGAFYCFALARACGPDQPFYALETYRFSAAEPVPPLATIAAAHIDAMRQVQPHGPYRLGGFCNGGLLAYEMARQLEASGERVGFLGLIDPSPPVQTSFLRAVCDGAQRARRAGSPRQADLYLRARHAQRHLYRRLRPHAERVRDFGKLLAIEPRLAAMFPPRDALYADYIGVLSWAAAGYPAAGRYHGPMTFFWAREEPAIAATWRPVIRHTPAVSIEEHPVPGTHLAAVTDHIDELAARLAECLEASQ